MISYRARYFRIPIVLPRWLSGHLYCSEVKFGIHHMKRVGAQFFAFKIAALLPGHTRGKNIMQNHGGIKTGNLGIVPYRPPKTFSHHTDYVPPYGQRGLSML